MPTVRVLDRGPRELRSTPVNRSRWTAPDMCGGGTKRSLGRKSTFAIFLTTRSMSSYSEWLVRRTIEYRALYRNVISMTLSTFKIKSRRFTSCFNFQQKHNLLVDSMSEEAEPVDLANCYQNSELSPGQKSSQTKPETSCTHVRCCRNNGKDSR